MELTILERGDGITHVALAGRLDSNAAEQLEQPFFAATAAQNRPAIVDLSQIDFMASRGIGLLIASGKRLMKAGHRLVLLNPQGIVAGVLKTSKADLLVPIVHDIEEAVRVLGGGRAAAGAASVETGVAPRESQAPPREAVSAPGDDPREAVLTGPGVGALPSAPSATMKFAMKNERSELDVLNAAVAEYLTAHEVPARAAYAVNLATEELIVNVIQYAYVDDEPHSIEVELGLEGDQIVLTIVDDGMPFDPRKGPSLNVHAEDYEGGGMGLLLVLDMVDVLKYRREDERNRVEVRIHLAAEDQASNSSEAMVI